MKKKLEDKTGTFGKISLFNDTNLQKFEQK